MNTCIRLIVILSSLIISTAAIATDKNLIEFKPDGTMNVSQAELSQGIAARYLIDIDPDVISQSSRVKPRNVDWAKPSGDFRDFLLFPTGENLIFKDPIRLKPERYGQYAEGVDTYSGSVVDDESGSFTLSVSNNQVTGQVQIGQMLLDLRFDRKAKSHILSVIDLLLMPKDTNEPDYSLENINSLKTNKSTSTDALSTG